jgi:hypothetical protein
MVMGTVDPVQGSGEALADMLVDLEQLIDEIVRNPAGLVPAALEDTLAPAWSRVRPKFEPLREAVRALDDENLEQVGLIDDELTMKLAFVRVPMREALARVTYVPRHPREAAAWVAHALGLADPLLESVAKVLPPPADLVAHRIVEFKSFVEKGAEVMAGEALGGQRRSQAKHWKI